MIVDTENANKKPTICFKCGKIGHTAQICRSYPPNNFFRNNNSFSNYFRGNMTPNRFGYNNGRYNNGKYNGNNNNNNGNYRNNSPWSNNTSTSYSQGISRWNPTQPNNNTNSFNNNPRNNFRTTPNRQFSNNFNRNYSNFNQNMNLNNNNNSNNNRPAIANIAYLPEEQNMTQNFQNMRLVPIQSNNNASNLN